MVALKIKSFLSIFICHRVRVCLILCVGLCMSVNALCLSSVRCGLSFWIVSNTRLRDNGRLPLGSSVRKFDKRMSPFNKGRKTRPSETLHPPMMTGCCKNPPRKTTSVSNKPRCAAAGSYPPPRREVVPAKAAFGAMREGCCANLLRVG